MGDFDDVLAMGPGEDWDDWEEYAAGDDPRPLVELAPLVMELQLPGALVCLHGKVPETVREALVDLARTADAVLGTPELVQLSFDESDGLHTVVDVERGVLLEARSGAELLDGLIGVLVEAAVREAPHAVHLDAGLVELGVGRDARGVLFLGPPALRLGVVDSLRQIGAASVLGDGVVSLLPGSRTVTAVALPVRTDEGWRPLSADGPLGSHAVVDLIVVLSSGGPTDLPGSADVHPADAVLELLRARRHGGLPLPDALDTVAATVAGASVRRCVELDPTAVAAMLSAAGRAERPSALGLRSDGAVAPETRWAVLDDGVVEADATGAVRRLAGAEALPPLAPGRHDDAIGTLATTVPDSSSAESVDVDVDEVERVLVDVCARIVAAGSAPVVLGAAVLAEDGPLAAGPLQVGPQVGAVELLVPRDELPDLVEQLMAAGFAATLDPAADLMSGAAVRLAAPGSGVPVLLHDRLAAGPFGELVDHEEFHDRSVPFRVGGHWLRALHPEDRFVLACVRLALAEGAPPDLVQEVVFAAPRAPVLLASALEASERWGSTRSTLAAVREVDRSGAGLPAWLVDRARRGDGPPVPGMPPRRRRGRRSRRR